jgi:hypothetical protein
MSIAINGTDGITFNDGSLQPSAIGKNLIINGNMQIAQRGTSATGITSSGYYVVDRFQHGIGSMGTWSISQSTDVPTGQGFANSLKMDCTTADASPAVSDTLIVRQKIEGQNLQQLKKGTANAEKVTVSFWVKSAKTGTYILELDDRDNTRDICQSYTIDTADTWEKKTLTFDGDTTGAFDNDNNSSLWLSFWLGAGTNFTSGTLATSWTSRTDVNRAVGQVNLADSTANYINITGVQLEANTTATPFENLMYSQQLALCQRYYTNITGSSVSIVNCAAWSATTMFGVYNYPTTMRAVPTMTYSALADFECYMNAVARTPSQFLSEYGDENGTRLKMQITGGVLGYAGWYAIDSGGGTLEFSAEL